MPDKFITIACDSCAGVGALDCDIVKSSGYFAGYRTAFVPLIETLAIGAKPLLLTNTLSVSGDDYGAQIICGIKDAARDAGIFDANAITGSTEENFKIAVTSLGVTVIGEMPKNTLPKAITHDYSLYLAGLPKVGSDVIACPDAILSFDAIKYLKASKLVHDVLPVGSKGIAFETTQMCDVLGAHFKPDKHIPIDLFASAGPATCALFAVLENVQDLFSHIDIPIHKLGTLISKKS